VSDGSQHPAIRASDAEREATVDRLRQSVVDGRLTLEEFSDRVGLAQRGPFASQVIHSPEAPPVPGAPVLRIKASGPGGTLYVRNRRERLNHGSELLGTGDPDA
jgi:hypothetical protein